MVNVNQQADGGIPIAHEVDATQGYTAAGMAAFTGITITLASGGDIGIGLFFLGVSAFSAGIALAMQYLSSPLRARLHPDRLVLDPLSRTPDSIEWRTVESVSWPNLEKGTVRLEVRDPQLPKPRKVFVDLEYVVRPDRATLIAYIHAACNHAEQINWPKFCARHAVPLLKDPQHETKDHGPQRQLSRSERFFTTLWLALAKHPFIAGLLLPLGWLCLIPMVSRKTWWLTAVLFLLSGALNFAILWNQLIPAYILIWLAGCGCLFLFGAISPSSAPWLTGRNTMRSSHAVFWTAVAIVGVPLVLTLHAVGRLPKGVAAAILLSILILAFVHAIIAGNAQAKQSPPDDAARLARWDQFERELAPTGPMHHSA